MSTRNWPMPDYLVDEIAARVDYTRLSWLERLVTPPPVGWPGGHLARAVARGVGAARIRKRVKKETSE